MRGIPSSLLPHPDDKHPAPLRPTERQTGKYVYERTEGDTEVRYTEPSGSSFMLEFFECEILTRNLLRISEVATNRIMDNLWNFFRISFDVDNPEIVRLVK